ncbi:MAG: DegT/DnrJ/EryC1/StrS family aminotransferase [Comamonadaceae bacterium]|nr:DegT/DnrJ/EryC1/StrS family aminotransferase [Comamonadaceae bacterium]
MLRRAGATRWPRRYDDLLRGPAADHASSAAPESRSALHLYADPDSHDALAAARRCSTALRADGIGVNVHYIPVHLQPYYRELGFRPGAVPRRPRPTTRAAISPAAVPDADRRRGAGDRVVAER